MQLIDDVVDSSTARLIARAANEGIPIAAIGRITLAPFDAVAQTLEHALSIGEIGHMPKSDWPPTARIADHLPTVPPTSSNDLEFHAKRLFKLTKLEVGFLVVLLKYGFLDKERLHGVIEQQRAARPSRPDKQEITDPKMVDVIICKLRKKLRAVDEGFILKTSWGQGYYFDAEIKDAILRKVYPEKLS